VRSFWFRLLQSERVRNTNAPSPLLQVLQRSSLNLQRLGFEFEWPRANASFGTLRRPDDMFRQALSRRIDDCLEVQSAITPIAATRPVLKNYETRVRPFSTFLRWRTTDRHSFRGPNRWRSLGEARVFFVIDSAYGSNTRAKRRTCHGDGDGVFELY